MDEWVVSVRSGGKNVRDPPRAKLKIKTDSLQGEKTRSTKVEEIQKTIFLVLE